MQKINLLFWIVSLIIVGCTSQEESEMILKQAHEIHLEAIKLNKTVQSDLKSVIQSKDQIKGRVGELDLEEKTFVRKVEQLERSYLFWKDNHVEVPGFEHHDHGHNHNHGATLEVSPEDMLLIQQEFKDSIVMISKRLEAITLPTATQ